MTKPSDLLADKTRGDFPILHQTVRGKPLVYLDSAATSQKPQVVIDALVRYYQHDNANVHRGLHELSTRATQAYEGARGRVAQFLDASTAEEIVFTRGTTESINLVAQAWGRKNLRPGDVVLLTEMEHHSNLVPWQLITGQTGASVRYVPVSGRDGLIDPSEVKKYLTPDVKLFAFTHISNSLGTVNPVKEFCELARSRGIVTLIDAAQSAGHRPVSVREIDCDFLAFSGHKVCGPTGIGVLWGRSELLNAMDPWQGGGEMIASVRYEGSTWKPAPYRFEAGTPNIAGAVGLHAALDYLDKIGRAAIAAHDEELAAYAYARVKEIPGTIIIGPEKGRAGLVSLALESVHAHDLSTFLDQQAVAIRAGHHCNQPLMRRLGFHSTARASFYFYNTTAEIDRFVDVLREAVEYFK
ncbi:MAG TPA: cysteine desulfurase [Opitutaceae bacterium]|nr:cysteine desulfurase [Opitutaceae bacterium]